MANWDLYTARLNINASTIKDRQLNDAVAGILRDFIDSPSVHTVTVNKNIEPISMAIMDDGSISDTVNDIKTFAMKPNEYVNVGDIIHWDNSDWLVTKAEMFGGIYQRGNIQVSYDVLKLYINGSLEEVPFVVYRGSTNLEEGKFISYPADEQVIICANNAITQHIKLDSRFVLSGNAYVVKAVDNLTKAGLLTLRIKEDVLLPSDNLASETTEQHIYSINILNGETASIVQGATQQLNIEVSENNIILSPTPTITYTSSDETICVIDANGLITSVGIGSCIITASVFGVSDNISIEVVSALSSDSFTVSVSGASTVKLNNNVTLTANVFNNGSLVTQDVVWSVSNQDGTSNQYLSLVSQDGSNITLRATSNSSYISKYVIIRASLINDTTIFVDHTIQIKSLF